MGLAQVTRGVSGRAWSRTLACPDSCSHVPWQMNHQYRIISQTAWSAEEPGCPLTGLSSKDSDSVGLGQGPRNLILGHILPHQVILMMMQIWEIQQDGKAIMDKRMQSSSYKAGLQVRASSFLHQWGWEWDSKHRLGAPMPIRKRHSRSKGLISVITSLLQSCFCSNLGRLPADSGTHHGLPSLPSR